MTMPAIAGFFPFASFMMYLALAEGSPVKSRCLNRVLPQDVETRLDPVITTGILREL